MSSSHDAHDGNARTPGRCGLEVEGHEVQALHRPVASPGHGPWCRPSRPQLARCAGRTFDGRRRRARLGRLPLAQVPDVRVLASRNDSAVEPVRGRPSPKTGATIGTSSISDAVGTSPPPAGAARDDQPAVGTGTPRPRCSAPRRSDRTRISKASRNESAPKSSSPVCATAAAISSSCAVIEPGASHREDRDARGSGRAVELRVADLGVVRHLTLAGLPRSWCTIRTWRRPERRSARRWR